MAHKGNAIIIFSLDFANILTLKVFTKSKIVSYFHYEIVTEKSPMNLKTDNLFCKPFNVQIYECVNEK